MVQTPYRCIHGDEDTVIGGISYDSRRAKEGDVFLCIVGEKTDGHEYIGEVLDKKIAALVVEKEKVLVPELRKRLGRTVVLAVPDTSCLLYTSCFNRQMRQKSICRTDRRYFGCGMG